MSKNQTLARGIRWKPVTIPAANEGEPEQVIFVRGLSPNDIAQIMREDGGENLAGFYVRLTKPDVTPEDLIEAAMDFIGDIPDVAAHIIARAADLKDEWELVRDFATGDQIELLKAVGEMTFTSEAVTKKMMEAVAKFGKDRLARTDLLTP